ncbi:MAG: geranylgeranylglycerol-phosphate geranylgeranyltransferase [Bacteroidetes bacterium]|nr:geranylgeranylglycerol-phosphate geranylgeranyltransferase [Bacteroidota bacterium]
MPALFTFLRLTRFWNLLIVGITQYCTAWFIVHHETLKDPGLLLLSMSTILIAAAGYIINDYYDVKIDLINKPERVVIGKEMSRRLALMSHVILSAVGIMLGTYLSWKIGVIQVAAVFALWLYSNALKRLPFVGNFVVALLTGATVLMVSVLYPPLTALVCVYALFAFFMTLVREIIKDVEDLKGDDTFGCRTLPILWGVRPTKQFTYALLLLFAISVVLLHKLITPLPMGFFIGFLFVPMLILVIWLIRADTKRDFQLLSRFCKWIMLAGIGSMAFL